MRRDNIGAKHKLQNVVNVSIKTTMIGALSIFEEYFADEIEKDPEKWEKARTEILNRGHECMDIARSHVNRYNIQHKNAYFDFKK